MKAPRIALCLPLVLAACSPSDSSSGTGAPAKPSGPPWFEEVASASGVEFTHMTGFEQRYWFPEIIGSGVALFDYDGDGDIDLYAVQSGDLSTDKRKRPSNKLFRNEGDGTFTDVTDAAGVGDRRYGMGCVVGDYDNDGDLDLYVTNCGPNVLYRNEGDGTFTDATAAAGVGHDGWGMSGALVDVDGDGDLDLFVTNYVNWSIESELECTSTYGTRDYCEPINYNAPAPDVLFRNEGDGTFLDVTNRYGMNKAFGNGMGVATGDFDLDGRDDVYVANDGVPNQLWMNRGEGADEHLEDASLLAGCAVNADGHAEASMGVGTIDADEDGDVDLFMTHLRGETNTLYINDGGIFTDRTTRTGMSSASLRYTSFGLGFADFDLDAHSDLYIVNGRVGLWKPSFSEVDVYVEPDQVFRGAGGGRFEEVAPQGGTSELQLGNSRGLALGDIDNDGDVDAVVLDNGGRLRLLRNVVERKGGWISFSALSAAGTTGAAAIGARLEIEAGGRTRHRRVNAASSYLSSNDLRVHVGLGDASTVDEVRVRWPGGAAEVFGPFDAGAIHTLRQGQGRAR
jgi:hypothetical protein